MHPWCTDFVRSSEFGHGHIGGEDHTHFRGLAARCNYLATDKPDCQFAAKEVCRFISKPTKLSVEVIKRIGRHLIQ